MAIDIRRRILAFATNERWGMDCCGNDKKNLLDRPSRIFEEPSHKSCFFPSWFFHSNWKRETNVWKILKMDIKITCKNKIYPLRAKKLYLQILVDLFLKSNYVFFSVPRLLIILRLLKSVFPVSTHVLIFHKFHDITQMVVPTFGEFYFLVL